MGKGGKHLKISNIEIKELQDSLHELDNWVVDLYKQLDMKDKLIEALQRKLMEKEHKMPTMQMVDVTCDTNDLMVYTNTKNDMIDDSLSSHEMKSFIK